MEDPRKDTSPETDVADAVSENEEAPESCVADSISEDETVPENSAVDGVSEEETVPEENGVVDGVSEEETVPQGEAPQPKRREFRGLYKHVKISVRTLDIIIAICLVVIVVFLVIDLQNPGFTITFDSKGGSDVAPQNQMYGTHLDAPDPPTREGYRFTGWYTDYACLEAWDLENDTIQSDITLYAGWEPIANE